MFAFLVRLILFTIAISAIRSVIVYIQRLWMGTQQRRPVFRTQQQGGQPVGQQAGQTSPTMLQQDPVCGTYVAVDTSLKRVVGGHVFHFCSDACRDRFRG
jgi:YHS domain-containing protein